MIPRKISDLITQTPKNLPVSVFLLLLTTLGLLAIWVGLYVEDLFKDKIVVSLFSIFAIYIITEKVQAIFSARAEDQIRNEVVSLKDEILDSLLRTLDVRRIGLHSEGLSYAARRMKRAKFIQDTYFRNEQDLVIPAYPDEAAVYYRGLADIIIRGGSVDILCSSHNIPIWNEAMADIKDVLSDQNTMFRVQLRKLDNRDISLINMIILTYEGDSREVIFGWNFRSKNDGVVFSSVEERVIRYFDGLYDELRRVTEPVDLSGYMRKATRSQAAGQ